MDALKRKPKSMNLTEDAPSIARRLHGPPVELERAVTELPTGPGLYAWWAAPTILSGLDGPANDTDPTLRLLYIGRPATCASPGPSTRVPTKWKPT